MNIIKAVAAPVTRLGAMLWAPMAPFEILEARPCLDDKEAQAWGAHALFHIPDTRKVKVIRNPDADGQPQRLYAFKVNRPKHLWNADDDIKEYIHDYFQRLDLLVLGITVKRENGDWKYHPFYAEY